MEERDRGAERAGISASGRLARIRVSARIHGRSPARTPGRLVTPAAQHRTIAELRRRLAAGTLVPDAARIARALLERGLV